MAAGETASWVQPATPSKGLGARYRSRPRHHTKRRDHREAESCRIVRRHAGSRDLKTTLPVAPGLSRITSARAAGGVRRERRRTERAQRPDEPVRRDRPRRTGGKQVKLPKTPCCTGTAAPRSHAVHRSGAVLLKSVAPPSVKLEEQVERTRPEDRARRARLDETRRAAWIPPSAEAAPPVHGEIAERRRDRAAGASSDR